ncbi:uncharacterized protein J8A68_003747 [[Candida] subhashii]|uniref:Uncharacterized protein n=1 Tax=[Candida] subhashii TaxID=561895 RepID=A0A8J5Q856_9ASCO|nr:uncharacterized protein J8A68_003747 [[Candida] subhashii]KAG7662759.1 hypothetical protein J8A68_003747 [[Candida] subhashii]
MNPTSPPKQRSGIVFGDLSPVKLNLSTKTTYSPPVHDHHYHQPHRTPDLIIHHPHGLNAKHEARRNTIGHNSTNKRKSLVNTPLIDPKRSTMTSPTNSQNGINLDSIRKSKQYFDSKIPQLSYSGKENADPAITSSSPMRFDHSLTVQNDDSPLKHPVYFDNHDSPLKRRPEEGLEEDISFSVSKKKSKGNSSHLQSDSRYDNKDDVSIEEIVEKLNQSRSRIADSSSIIRSGGVDEVDHHDGNKEDDTEPHTLYNKNIHINKLRKNSNTFDYFTPERYTEPTPKSPNGHQSNRINMLDDDQTEDVKLSDSTSPLKTHKFRNKHANNDEQESHEKEQQQEEDELEEQEEEFTSDQIISRLENEPTINFLMSPNSKPIFSRDHVSKIQQENEARINELNEEINIRDSRVSKLNEEVFKLEESLVSTQQELRDLKESKTKLLNNEEFLSIQLKHNERELASLTKSFKIQENSLMNLRKRLDEKQTEFEEASNTVELLTEQVEILRRKVKELKRDLIDETNSNSENKTQLDQLIRDKKRIEQENEHLLHKLAQAEDQMNSKSSELNSLYEDLKHQYSELNQHYEALEKERKKLEQENDSLVSINKELSSQNELNARLIKEYDTITEEKVADLETQLESARSQHQEATANLTEEYEQKLASLSSEISQAESQTQTLSNRMNQLEQENSELHQTQNRLEAAINDKTQIISEKEHIISEDMTKMTQLIEAISKVESESSTTINSLNSQIQSLQDENSLQQKQIDSLTEKLETANQDAELEIQRVSHDLHQAYSKKHSKKLDEAKAYFEQEREGLNKAKREAQRQLDISRRQLQKSENQVRQLMEIFKANNIKVPIHLRGGSPDRSNVADDENSVSGI